MAHRDREARRRARQRQRQARAIAFGAVVIAALGLAGYFLKPVLFRPAPPPMSGNVVDVAASMSGFDLLRGAGESGDARRADLEG